MEEFDYTPSVKTKRISFGSKVFVVTNKPSEEYKEWVGLTAKLVGKPYMVMHSIFTKEKWSLDKIKTNYILATKHNGVIPSDVYWWYCRKKEKGVK